MSEKPRKNAAAGDKPLFVLADARPAIETALEAAGFDVLPDPREPNLIQARRAAHGDATVVIVDAGGQMRYTRTRQTAAEAAETRAIPAGRRWQVTRRRDETITVSSQLRQADARDFGAVLRELDSI